MFYVLFTALHERGPAMRILSVSLSVCLSIKRVICDKTKEICAGIFKKKHEKPFTLVS